MIDLRRLEILRELARCGTIAATADAVHLTPSAVSQQLATLTREVGTAVIEPDGRRVRLTAAAELLLHHAHNIFTHLEHAESDLARFREGDAGTVRVGGFATAISALGGPLLAAMEERSGVRVEIVQVDPTAAPDALLGRRIDIALTMSAGLQVPGADDPRLENWRVLDDILDMAMSLNHPLADRSEVTLDEFAGDDWILGSTGSPCWIVAHDACARAGFAPRARHQADDYMAWVSLVSTGAVVGLLPRLAQRPFRHEQIAIIPVAQTPSPFRRIEVQYRAGTANQPHIAPVLAALRDVSRSGLTPAREHAAA